jgi:hypothetical protein
LAKEKGKEDRKGGREGKRADIGHSDKLCFQEERDNMGICTPK